MRLVSFKSVGGVTIGAVVDDKVVHLNALLSAVERVPDDMTAFLMAGEPAMAAARKAIDAFKRGASIFKMMDQSRHRSVETLRGYVRDAEIFKEHAGAGLL